MGCGASTIDRVMAKPYEPSLITKDHVDDPNETHISPIPRSQSNLLEPSDSSASYKLEESQEDGGDPVLKTLQEMIPSLQQKSEQKTQPLQMDDVQLPGTPQQETEEDPKIVAAMETAKAVEEEVVKQITAGRQIAEDVTISHEKREMARRASEELDGILPSIVEIARDAFVNPQNQFRLRELIERIKMLNRDIANSLKPDDGKEILVLPKAKDFDEENNVAENDQMEEEFEKMKEEAKRRHKVLGEEKKKKKTTKSNPIPKKERKITEDNMGVEDLDDFSHKVEPEDEIEQDEKPWNQLETKSVTFPRGDTYTGQFNAKGMQHGKGTYQFANGDHYEGSFKDGKFHGFGKFQSHDGDSYEGEFVNDKYHGKGFFTDESGDRYRGHFEKGERNGYGVYEYSNGEKYEGYFKDGERNGKGTFQSSDGKTKYEGEYRNGKRHGYGILEQKGNRYEGGFENGKMNGKGILEYENGNVYDGEFHQGALGGRGKMSFTTGNNFEGMINKDGTFESGMLSYANGDVYTGSFSGRKPHGKGFLIYSNGESYEGFFANGKRHGQGKLVKKNGESQQGEFLNGKFVPPPKWGKIDYSKAEEERKKKLLQEEEQQKREFERLKENPEHESYQPKSGW